MSYSYCFIHLTYCVARCAQFEPKVFSGLLLAFTIGYVPCVDLDVHRRIWRNYTRVSETVYLLGCQGTCD